MSNSSRLLENLVFVDLVRRGADNLELIQVAQDISSLKTREREIRALRQGSDELKSVLKMIPNATEDRDSYRDFVAKCIASHFKGSSAVALKRLDREDVVIP